ncbi:MAG TPA: methyltransferase domain-containing protein [Phycisphaerales bacterium]|nr:methyltransferase domain-containing protein [Phycisphaerales bacterium]
MPVTLSDCADAAGMKLRNRDHGQAKYFTHLREDVLGMVPANARAFLSVGCGSGRTEAELVKRGCSVTGIELMPGAAGAAREHGLEVLEGDVSEMTPRLAGRAFDCLIYADVLEHLADPVAVLRQHVPLLRPGGCAIVSVPNFRHHSVFRALFLHGHIRYVDAGIFDYSHLRITTRKMVAEWFGEVGLRPDMTRYNLWRRREKVVSAALLGSCREFLASQVVLRGIKP